MTPTRSATGLVVAAAIVLCLVGALLLVSTYPMGATQAALTAFWTGSVGSWYALSSATLVRAVPLMLAGCAVAVAFRAGVFNIGAEGQFLVGATGAIAVALALPHAGFISTIVALLAGAVAGMLWAGIAAWLRVQFGVLEVISTIMLNFVALYMVSYFVRGPLQEPTRTYPQTATIAEGIRLTRIPGAGRLHVGIFLALAVLITSGWVFRNTAAGFRLLAVGENMHAAESAGQIHTVQTTRNAFLMSGALAGLAGAAEVLGVTFALYENISPGYGYTAIAVALLARLDPWRIILSSLLFAVLEAGSGAMQRDAGVPATLGLVVEALIILFVVGTQAIRRRVQVDSIADASAGNSR